MAMAVAREWRARRPIIHLHCLPVRLRVGTLTPEPISPPPPPAAAPFLLFCCSSTIFLRYSAFQNFSTFFNLYDFLIIFLT